MDLGLAGKVIAIGGGSRGLGYAIAQCVAAEGAAVSLMARDASQLEAAAARLRTAGAAVTAHALDASDPGTIERWIDGTAAEHGRLDGVVSNAGGPLAGTFADFADEDWRRAFDLVLLSAIRTARAAHAHLAAVEGSLLFVTSSSVREPIPHLTLSTVLRAGVAALAKDLATAWASSGVRVNQIIPGRVDTDRVRQLDRKEAEASGVTPSEIEARAVARIPLGRYGEPLEFGRAAAFLLAPAASYVTGATLQVDGGLLRGIS